jgi:hypothetical protein
VSKLVPDPSLVAEIDMRDRTMEVLTELIDLDRILLNLARSRISRGLATSWI